MTCPEELVELVARTNGYVIHHVTAPNDKTADDTRGTTSSKGKAVDRGGKRASETDYDGGNG